ncbi:MAG: VOC family protein [Dehalococcoidia bacterium]|nr:VOC family protein [Dehalococcoidia bacterium]
MRPQLFRVIVPVDDIERAASFYEALLGFVGERVSPGRHYFDCGGVILACVDPRADGDAHDARPNPDHVYLAVDSVEEALTRAGAAGATPLNWPGEDAPIAYRPWGERSFYTRDPFGNPLCFVQRGTEYRGGPVPG